MLDGTITRCIINIGRMTIAGIGRYTKTQNDGRSVKNFVLSTSRDRDRDIFRIIQLSEFSIRIDYPNYPTGYSICAG
jgi:hypothetical protein